MSQEAQASCVVGHNTVLHNAPNVVKAGDINMLATNIYFEERTRLANNTITDLDAAQIGFVVLNRVYTKRYPSTLYGVIYQRKQFSWTHDGKHYRMIHKQARQRAIQIATMVLYGTIENKVGDADHYLNKDVSRAGWWKGMYTMVSTVHTGFIRIEL